jgi:phospholipid/cholesterol/gamma-HCH transport system substrate-binding protein
MEFKANEIKTGAFIFATLVILGIFLVSIFGVDFGKKSKEYQIYLQYVGGIAQGSLVKFRGMNVGQVTEIKLPDDNEIQIAVKLEVDENTPVRTDSKVFLTAIGLMADQHIEITAGSLQADLLPPGSIIESKEALSFAEITETLGEFNERMQGLINQVSDVFNEKNRTHLASTIENFDTLMEEGREPFLKTVSNLNALSGQLEKMSTNMTQLVDQNRGKYEEILSNLEATTRATKQMTTDLKNTTKNLETLMSRNNVNLSEIIESFQITSQNLEEFSRTLKEQPWTLVRKAAPPERDIP